VTVVIQHHARSRDAGREARPHDAAVGSGGPDPHGDVAEGQVAQAVAAGSGGQFELRDGLGDDFFTFRKGQGRVCGIGESAHAPAFVVIPNPAVEADHGARGGGNFERRIHRQRIVQQSEGRHR